VTLQLGFASRKQQSLGQGRIQDSIF